MSPKASATYRLPYEWMLSYSSASRARRMEWLLDVFDPQEGMRVIDLGGLVHFWDGCPVRLDLTILNLPGLNPPSPSPSRHKITLVEADALATPFDGNAYDLAFSNSVIEHVGDAGNRSRLAAEVRRLAPRYWVQTPSIWFPIEPHTIMPFWWFYPAPIKNWFMTRWSRVLPGYREILEETTVLSKREMMALFPDAVVATERKFGIPKSYVAYKA